MGRTGGAGDELTAAEETMIANMAAGTYANIVPSGTIDGVNDVFTLPASPSPASSLHIRKNGTLMKAGGEDYNLTSGLTVTFVAGAIPLTGSILLATFLVDTDT